MDYKVKYIQFNNGTELISRVDFEDWENTNHIRLYDPYRLYPIPPFLNLGDTDHQTLILIKWLPWTEDSYINIMTNNILVVTDVSARMQEYYDTSIQRSIEELIDREFRKFEEVPEPPLFDDELESIEGEGVEGESVEELAELLTEITKLKKRVLH